MRNQRFGRLCGVVLAALVAVAASGVVHAQEVERFIKVTDRDGEPVTDLGAGDFRVEHDGRRVDDVRVELVDQPLRVALIVDDADGAGLFFRYMRDYLPEFVRALPEDAEIGLILLSGRPRTVVDYTDGRDEVIETLGEFFVEEDRGGRVLRRPRGDRGPLGRRPPVADPRDGRDGRAGAEPAHRRPLPGRHGAPVRARGDRQLADHDAPDAGVRRRLPDAGREQRGAGHRRLARHRPRPQPDHRRQAAGDGRRDQAAVRRDAVPVRGVLGGAEGRRPRGWRLGRRRTVGREVEHLGQRPSPAPPRRRSPTPPTSGTAARSCSTRARRSSRRATSRRRPSGSRRPTIGIGAGSCRCISWGWSR